MTEDNMENETPKNNEGEEQPPEAVESEELTKAKEVADNYKIRAEKAEKENKDLKANTKVETETPKKEKQSNELDNTDRLDKLTLRQDGITNSDDIKLVLEEASRLKLPVEEIVAMEHIKVKLKDSKDQREAEDGMPSGKGKEGSGTKDSVEYWKNKKNKDGSYATPDDLELANKVISARVKEEEDGNVFSDELY